MKVIEWSKRREVEINGGEGKQRGDFSWSSYELLGKHSESAIRCMVFYFVDLHMHMCPPLSPLFPLFPLTTFQNIRSINLCANSTPKNVAAFAGTALAIAGPIPGKNALNPPLA